MTSTDKLARASDWRPHSAGTLQGFFCLLLPSGLKLNDLALHERDGERWVSLPSKPQIDAEGRVRTDLVGKRLYVPSVEIPSSEVRSKFREQALAALDRLLAQGPGHDPGGRSLATSGRPDLRSRARIAARQAPRAARLALREAWVAAAWLNPTGRAEFR
jgi:hypothetical protein